MNILSLFDGMSCGQIALNKLGIKYDNYYASEIDKYAIKVTQKNYPNTIQLGDITKLDLNKLPTIDLLIGGSPCQGFSIAGKGLNFDDPRSKLFFEYVKILKILKPKYFLLENVKMKKEWQDIITQYMGVEPILINGSLLSAQSRNRVYWTNIPNVSQPIDKDISLKDIVMNWDDELLDIEIPTEARINYIKRRASKGWVKDIYITKDTKKAACITAVCYKTMKEYAYKDDDKVRFLSCIELERLQTVPDNYTNNVSKTQRRKMLGNAWLVDVIVHIFKNIKN